MYEGSKHLGYGFVTFAKSQSALNAINYMNGVVYYNRMLEVSIKMTKAERNLAKKVSTLPIIEIFKNNNCCSRYKPTIDAIPCGIFFNLAIIK